MQSKLFFLFLLALMVSCGGENDDNEKVNNFDLTTQEPKEKETNDLKSNTRSPLLLSKDFGISWESISGDLPKDIQVSFLEQKGDEIVLASDNKGVFLSRANKKNWQAIGRQLPNQKINALAVNGNRIYAGVYHSGVYVTGNEGENWQALNYDIPNLNVQAIFKSKEHLLVGTDDGLFRLEEGKQSWQPTSVRSQVVSIYEYDGNMIVGTSQGTLLSKDKGNTWKWIRQEGAVHYTHPVRKRIVELALNGNLIYSDDWGTSWDSMSYQPRIGSYIYEIIEIGTYQLISNNYGIHRSEDNGKNWHHIFKTEDMAFFDFLVIDNIIYGGTRAWDEYRKKE